MAFTIISGYNAAGQGDNGSAAGPSVSLSVINGAQGFVSGDLVVLVVQFKGNSTISITGGTQTWTAFTQQSNGTSSTARMFWCVWNGTDETATVGVTSGTTALTAMVFQFRPASGKTPALDVTQSAGTFTNASATVTITAPTVSANSVTLASWMSEDDNTWGTLTGSGWSKSLLFPAGAAQMRNLTGTDQSMTQAYNLSTAGGALANVAQTMGGVGSDPGIWMIAAWKETSATTNSTLTADAGSYALSGVSINLTYTQPFYPHKPYIFSQAVNRANTY